jgi:hypothetical protein
MAWYGCGFVTRVWVAVLFVNYNGVLSLNLYSILICITITVHILRLAPNYLSSLEY